MSGERVKSVACLLKAFLSGGKREKEIAVKLVSLASKKSKKTDEVRSKSFKKVVVK